MVAAIPISYLFTLVSIFFLRFTLHNLSVHSLLFEIFASIDSIGSFFAAVIAHVIVAVDNYN
jgi:hypothetical protein